MWPNAGASRLGVRNPWLKSRSLTRIYRGGVDMDHGGTAFGSPVWGQDKRSVPERDNMRDHRMKTSSLLLALSLASFMAPTGGAQAADAASGGALARRLCVNCHVVAPGEGAGQA